MTHECIHNKIMEHEEMVFADTPSVRNLQSGGTPQPIRVTADYTNLAGLPSNMSDHIIRQVEVAIKYLNHALKVIPVSGNLKFPSSTSQCGSSS